MAITVRDPITDIGRKNAPTRNKLQVRLRLFERRERWGFTISGKIILVAITPMVDLFLLGSLPFGAWRAVLPFVITFLAMDVILATLACLLEREPIIRAWRILPMRLIYRPMLSYCIWKAIVRAIKGAWVSWGKLERTASVPARA